MKIYPNTKANAKRIGWEFISPYHFSGDPTASHVLHDHERGVFHFVEKDTHRRKEMSQPLSEEMKGYLADIICTGCDRIWDAIGHDVLAMSDGECSAAEVVEMCIDADRPKMFKEHDTEEAWEMLTGEFQNYAEQLEYVASKMPFQVYGY